MAVAVLAVAGCSSTAPTGSTAVGPSKPVKLAVKTTATVALLWTHMGTAIGGAQASCVVRITNPGSVPVSVTLNVNALDSSGTIVGSDQQTLPLGAQESFDYYEDLGGTGFSQLTGQPAKVQVSAVTGTPSQDASPKLRTSQLVPIALPGRPFRAENGAVVARRCRSSLVR